MIIGRLAQLARAPVLQTGSHRFKSCTAHQSQFVLKHFPSKIYVITDIFRNVSVTRVYRPLNQGIDALRICNSLRQLMQQQKTLFDIRGVFKD